MDLRNQILSADDLPSATVTLGAAYGGAVVLMKGMAAGDRLALTARHTKTVDEKTSVDMAAMLPEIVEKTAYDPATGALLFAPGDAAVIATKSATGTDPLFQAALRLNGFMDSDETTAGNSDAPPTDSSPSA